MSQVTPNQMVDEIIEAVDNARQHECPQQVRNGIIDSLHWINAYRLIERYKDELVSAGVVNDYDYVDSFGCDWVSEVIAFETVLKQYQRRALKVVPNSGAYDTGLIGGGEISEGMGITISGEICDSINTTRSQSGSWGAVDGQIGLGNVVDRTSNTITVDGGVGSHRLNGNGVLEVKTADGWVEVEANLVTTSDHGQTSVTTRSNDLTIGYRGQVSDDDEEKNRSSLSIDHGVTGNDDDLTCYCSL